MIETARKSHRTRCEKSCGFCGKQFRAADKNQQFCSRSCSSRSTMLSMGRKLRPTNKCCHCGCEFRHMRKADKGIFCSRKCSDEYNAENGKVGVWQRKWHDAAGDGMLRWTKAWVECAECGNPSYSATGASICSIECRNKRALRQQYESEFRKTGRLRGKQIIRQCVECGDDMQRTLATDRCHRCQKRADHVAKIRGNRRRKAILLTCEFEDFEPNEIHVRDNWTCHICAGRCGPRSHEYKPDAATLDHVVPLAKGGGHTRANVKTAHWLCNSAKSDILLSEAR